MADTNTLEDKLSSKMFKLALDYTPEHVVVTDPEGIILYANPAVAEITKFEIKDVLGTKAGKLWSYPMPKEFYEKLWTTIKTDRKVFAGKIKNRRKGGEPYEAQVSVAPILEGDKLVGFVGVEQDLTETNKQQEVLNQKMNDLERMNSLMVGREIMMVDLKKQISKLTEELEKLKAQKG